MVDEIRSSRARRALVLAAAALAVMAGAGWWLLRSSGQSSPPPAEASSITAAIPEVPGATELTGGFIATVSEGNHAGIRELVLRSGEAVASIKLADPTDYAGDEASGRAILGVDSRVAGAKFVSALARWLGASVVVESAAPAGSLPPLYGTYVRLPKSGGWEHFRLLFQHGASRAEMLLDISPRGDKARLIETSPALRDPLIAFLIAGLRDGFPRRADFAPGAPLWTNFRPLAGENGALVHAWPADGGAWGTIVEGKQSRIVWWSDLDHPPTEITKLDGLVTSLAPAPHARKAAVVLVHPSQDYPPGASGYASNDPVELMVVDATMAEPVPLIPVGKQLDFKPQVMWSPLGTSIAIEATDEKSNRTVRVLDISNQHEIASTTPADQHMLLEWTAKGLVFASASGRSPEGAPQLSFFRWLPADGAPVPLSELDERVSPDGRFQFRLVEGAVEVSGPPGVGPIPVVYADLREALEYAAKVRAWWLGGHRLLVVSDDLMALDLQNRQFRYLFPTDRTLLPQGVSPDGHVIIARDETDRLVWANETPSQPAPSSPAPSRP